MAVPWPVSPCLSPCRGARAFVRRVAQNCHFRAFWPVVRGLSKSNRVLRGGAFNNNDRNVRAAYRNQNNPNNRNHNNGFRVGVLHTFPIVLPEIQFDYG